MIREITIGQYYTADSAVHRLDPRVKLFSTILYIVSVFCFKGLIGFGLITLYLFSVIRLSQVPFRFIVRGLKAVLFLLLFTAVLNMFFTKGTNELWSYGILHITTAGIKNAVLMAIRLIYLIIGTSLMTLTTTPKQLTDGMESALSPLRVIHVPVHAIAMMMAIALRFIPILIDETDKIMKAQMARGADFENGNIIRRVKNMAPILIPLFVSAFRRADDLALAMEARCYNGGEGRTKMKPLCYHRRDFCGYLLSVLFLVLVILVRVHAPWPQ